VISAAQSNAIGAVFPRRINDNPAARFKASHTVGCIAHERNYGNFANNPLDVSAPSR
jgi:hypothetical protein